MATVTLENRVKNDYYFPVLETRTKKVQRHVIIEGGLVETETEEKVRYRADSVHLPGTFKPKEPGQVEVDREVYEQLDENPAFQALIEDGEVVVTDVN